MLTSHSYREINEGCAAIAHLKLLDDNESFQDWFDSDSGGMSVWSTIDYCNEVTGDSYRFFYAALDGATRLQKQWLSMFYTQALRSSYLFNKLSFITDLKHYEGPDAIVRVTFDGKENSEFKIENGGAFFI